MLRVPLFPFSFSLRLKSPKERERERERAEGASWQKLLARCAFEFYSSTLYIIILCVRNVCSASSVVNDDPFYSSSEKNRAFFFSFFFMTKLLCLPFWVNNSRRLCAKHAKKC